ncbi:hypothetical protein L207DRAFT_586473 [Hyaloscypha variabilis F]|uniref:Uncharacterized protein n=1 Tax=Hyaloscypha variabilis (strain UAMH 11265 / GT02V1 / F) TaxID=1149755 RepID=A0A2J6RE47_HYAVF|nr:hypothetical protein L207DRAFT_586473 [Hyaloscypha variabilis F]
MDTASYRGSLTLFMAVELILMVSFTPTATIIDKRAFDMTAEPMVSTSYLPQARSERSRLEQQDLSCCVPGHHRIHHHPKSVLRTQNSSADAYTHRENQGPYLATMCNHFIAGHVAPCALSACRKLRRSHLRQSNKRANVNGQLGSAQHASSVREQAEGFTAHCENISHTSRVHNLDNDLDAALRRTRTILSTSNFVLVLIQHAALAHDEA